MKGVILWRPTSGGSVLATRRSGLLRATIYPPWHPIYMSNSTARCTSAPHASKMSVEIVVMDVDPGVPPAPMVEVLRQAGGMPPGQWWFALVQAKVPPYLTGRKRPQDLPNEDGVSVMGPATRLNIETPWDAVKLSGIPMDDLRTKYAHIFMSQEGRYFYKMCTLPYANTPSLYGPRSFQAQQREDLDGIYSVTMYNISERWWQKAGDVIDRMDPQLRRASHDPPFNSMNEKDPTSAYAARTYSVFSDQPFDQAATDWPLTWLHQGQRGPSYVADSDGYPLNLDIAQRYATSVPELDVRLRRQREEMMVRKLANQWYHPPQ